MEEVNYDQIIKQLKSELNSECAIANQYGIVLTSAIKEFNAGNVIPHKIIDLIATSQEIANELKLKKINSFALESQKHNYLFTFSKTLTLISKLDLNVNLSKFMPSISVFLKEIEEKFVNTDIRNFSNFDFSDEIKKINDTLKTEKNKEDKYSIIKDLIKYISN